MSISVQSFLLSLLVLGFFSPSLYAADFKKPTATLERSQESAIRLNIEFAKLTTADLESLEIQPNAPETAANALIRLLDICVAAVAGEECGDSPKKAKYIRSPEIDKTPPTSQADDLTAEIDSGLYMDVDVLDNTLTVHAQILVKNISQDPAKAFSTSTQLATKIVYGNPPVTQSYPNITVSYSKGVIEAIQDPGVGGVRESITAYWTKTNQVELEGGGRGPPSGMLAVLLPRNIWSQASASLETLIYQSDYTQQTVGSSCPLSVDEALGTCTVNCPTAQVLDQQRLQTRSNEGLQLATSAGQNTINFNNLENDEKYVIVLQYLPDGLSKSCLIGSPSEALILTEITTGKEPQAGDANCFVATAAYGSPLHAQLNTLRWFRDHFLLRYGWSKALVHYYYKFGPAAASYIADKPTLRALVRGMLWGPVSLLESYRSKPDLTVFGGLILFIFIPLLFSLLWARKTRLAG